MRTQLAIYSLGIAFITSGAIQAQSPSPSSAADSVPVTPDNFNRAETDMIFAESVKTQGLGKFLHHREPMAIDFPIVRPNRDTLYSLSVFDLDAGPLTITLPNAGQRFMSMQVIDEDHYTPDVFYGAGSHTFTRDKIGTRYVSFGVRILVDHRLQRRGPLPEERFQRVFAQQDHCEESRGWLGHCSIRRL
jgi:hypothetical protein